VTNRNQPTTTRQKIMNEIMRQEHEAIMEWCHDVCDDMMLDGEFFGTAIIGDDNLHDQHVLELPIDIGIEDDVFGNPILHA
tara:strand:- start:18888 stop:19130 length:243 start_codon:yes stop_codon:yes gene_type:complete